MHNCCFVNKIITVYLHINVKIKKNSKKQKKLLTLLFLFVILIPRCAKKELKTLEQLSKIIQIQKNKYFFKKTIDTKFWICYNGFAL